MEHKTITISDQIFEKLEKDILSGVYAKDEFISESRLSADLGVSRTPVREALSRLMQEHFIEETGKGFVVIGITMQDMQDYYEIRVNLEGRAAEMTALAIGEEALADLTETCHMQRYYLNCQKEEGSDYSEKIKDLDSHFHETIYINTGSNAYRDTLLPIHKRMTKFRKASVRNVSRAEESIKEHEAILNALKNHDAELAKTLMTTHVINARDSISGTKEE